jgi:hypothetical protein
MVLPPVFFFSLIGGGEYLAWPCGIVRGRRGGRSGGGGGGGGTTILLNSTQNRSKIYRNLVFSRPNFVSKIRLNCARLNRSYTPPRKQISWRFAVITTILQPPPPGGNAPPKPLTHRIEKDETSRASGCAFSGGWRGGGVYGGSQNALQVVPHLSS